jgi:hypothetical protein
VDAVHNAPRPQLRWVPVVDDHGRRHMEMRWTCPTTAEAMAEAMAEVLGTAGPAALRVA